MNNNTLSRHDLQWALRLTPERVLKAMKDNAGALFMAGGFIRDCVTGDKPNDIDLFATSADKAKAIALDMAAKPADLHITDNAVTIKGARPAIQIIHRWTYATPEECVASFDFTIASAAIWWNEGWKSVCHERFYQDLAAHRLVYLAPKRNEDAGGSMLRVLKFYQRGYRIPLDSLAKVTARLIKGVDQDSPLFWTGRNLDGNAATEEEVERYRAKILGGLLREVDPNVDQNHIAHLPSIEDDDQTETTTEGGAT